MQADDINTRAVFLGQEMKARFQAVADATGRLENIRCIGGAYSR
jgi:hypothetical protein